MRLGAVVLEPPVAHARLVVHGLRIAQVVAVDGVHRQAPRERVGTIVAVGDDADLHGGIIPVRATAIQANRVRSSATFCARSLRAAALPGASMRIMHETIS